jgi:hypothetical protein
MAPAISAKFGDRFSHSAISAFPWAAHLAAAAHGPCLDHEGDLCAADRGHSGLDRVTVTEGVGAEMAERLRYQRRRRALELRQHLGGVLPSQVAGAAFIIEPETEIGDNRPYRRRLGLDALK